ncbi:uncharacterized protein LOC129598922 isoform X2 [Paramacrobiotus metropolitanus]|uniref:uncharacterized protein LOC129598922 isoform X2 n=1 Tax=Paramacrobiotus metropolitanus TaxID=2943436 RepID=UPI0024456030|nr:uncharacterized protein LOC129598922 isoform X2 [Paramacrobiotus metropolitanus]
MCSVYPRSHDTYAWNAVDVRASDGSLQHGRVINALNNGLIVDFECPGRNAAFVNPDLVAVRASCHSLGYTFDGTLDSAWHFNNAAFPPGDDEPRVEILARTSADRPWTWHATEPLYSQLFWQRYVFVEMQLDAGVKRRLMRAQPVRLPESADAPDSSEGRIGMYAFVTRAFMLPEDYWGGECVSAALWDAWKQAVEASEYAVWPVCLMGRTLVYLQELIKSPLEDEHLRLITEARNRLTQVPCESLPLYKPSGVVDALDGAGQMEMFCALPAAIFRQILDMLDSVHRAQCCRVCPLWDSLIGTEQRVIWVSFSHQRLVDEDGIATTPNETEWYRSAYLVGMCLWKCLTSITKIIIMGNASHQQPDNAALSDCFDLIDSVLIEQDLDENNNITVIVNKFYWDLGNCLDEDMHGAAAAVARVVWKDGTFSGPGEHFRHESIKYAVSCLSAEPVDVDGEPVRVHMNLSDVLERGLTVDCREARLQLKDWLADVASQEPESSDRQRIDTVLISCQESDPRVVSKFGKMQWSVDTVQGQDLDKLTKLTLCALQREMIRGNCTQCDSASS